MKIHVEVFIGAQILGKNQGTFSPDELIRFIEREFGDTRSGVRTHVVAACVANANLNHALGQNYLWRLGQGIYRPFQPGSDIPVPERKNHRTQPEREDVPSKYWYLLRRE